MFPLTGRAEPPRPAGLLLAGLPTARTMSRLIQKTSLAVAGHCYRATAMRGQLARDRCLITHLHGPQSEAHDEFVKNLPLRYFPIKWFFFFLSWYYYLIDYISINGSDRLIFINKSSYSFTKANFKFKKPFAIVYNSYENKNPTFKKIDFNEVNKIALIIGSTPIGKGLDIAIKAIIAARKKGANITLNIVGFKEFIRKKNNLPKYINYIGQIEPKDMVYAYKNADFLILPSRHESCGLVILEALSYGLPVIVSEACKFSEIENNHELGITVPGFGVRAWSEAIEHMCKKRIYNEFRKNISTCSKDNSLGGWDNSVQAFENFILTSNV
jgi:glycosyltransferase involved in cell wall biosynthesis